MRTVFRCCMLGSATPRVSRMEGMVSTCRPVCAQSVSTSPRSFMLAVGMAKMILVTRYFSAAERILSRPPTIGTPLRYLPCLLGLSSIRQTGRPSSICLPSSSRTRISPAEPAPMIIMRSLEFGLRLIRTFVRRKTQRMAVNRPVCSTSMAQ